MNYKNCKRLALNIIFSIATSLLVIGCASTSVEHMGKQPDGVGDWLGSLNVPGGNLRLWLSVERDPEGALYATLDSIDQTPGKKMTVQDISILENKLSFSIPKISAKYLGHWNSGTKQWDGTFTQGQEFDLNFSRGKPQNKPIYNELDGQWESDIMGHPLIVRISSGKTGTVAQLDSPDDGVRGLPISAIVLDDHKVSFEISKAKVKFNGILDESEEHISGKWTQKGQPSRQLTFTRIGKKKQ